MPGPARPAPPSDGSPGAQLPSARRESPIKASIKRLLARFDIYVMRSLPRGVSVSHDLRRAAPEQRFETVFDVGANVGQSIRRYLREFPRARIVAFEPSGRIFDKLARTFAGTPRVICEPLALGGAEGRATLVRTRDPTMHHLAFSGGEARDLGAVGRERVSVTTIDEYCERKAIASIDFLKIDTEGHDLEVILGAERMLSEARIAALQCECSVSPENTFHVPFDRVRAHLEAKGYRLFGFYEQVSEWTLEAPNLRRVNAVFISPRLAFSAGRAAPREG